MRSFFIQSALLIALLAVVAVIVTGGWSFGSKSKQPVRSQSESIKVRLLQADGSLTEPIAVPKVVRTDEEWRARLTPEQYTIARSQGTEWAFCGLFHDNHKVGIYSCVG